MPDTKNKPKGKNKTPYKPQGKEKKTLWFDSERLKECKAFAEKDGTTKQEKTVASFIQRNIGNFSKVEEFVRSRVSLIGSKIGKEEISDDEYEAFREMLEFIEALKTN